MNVLARPVVFAVGSTNKAKVKAVEMALDVIFPDVDKSVVAIKVILFSCPPLALSQRTFPHARLNVAKLISSC